MSFTCSSPFSIAWYRCATLQRCGMLKPKRSVSMPAASPVVVLRQVLNGASSSP